MEDTFTHKVHAVVRSIPAGQTLTYKQVAALAGSPNAYRAVGTILSHNFDPTIPCHRVIKSNGETGKYNRGREKKRLLLDQEAL